MKGIRMILAAWLVLAAVAQATPDTGKPAPAFSLPDLDGVPRALADYAGRVVVLEWTNYDCPFVKKHYGSGNMQALQRRFTEQGVVWLSICSSAPGKQGHFAPAEWKRRVAEAQAAPTAVLLDADGTVGRAYGARNTPHLFVIGVDGSLAYQGAIDDDPTWSPENVATARNYVAEALDALLAGQPVPTAETKPYGCSVKY